MNLAEVAVVTALLCSMCNSSSSSSGSSGTSYDGPGSFDVVAFGADSSGREPCDGAINAAIAGINARGGHATLVFPPGRYRVLAPLATLAGDDITVLGHGAHIDWMSTNHFESCLRFGPISSQLVTLRGDVRQGADHINLTAAKGVADQTTLLLRLNSSEVFYHHDCCSMRDNKKGELLVFGSTQTPTASGASSSYMQAFIYGKGPLFSYSAANTTATAIVPSRNIQVLGISLTGRGAEHENTAFRFIGCEGLLVSAVRLDAVNAGVSIGSCKAVTVSGNSFSDINKVGLGYSVMIGTFCLEVAVTGNVGDKGRHFVTTGGEDGVSRGITISGNTFRGSIEGAISPHAQGYDITISGNHISDSWIAIESRAPNTIITGNTVTNWGQPNASTVVDVQRMQIAIYTTEMGSLNTVISDNTLLYDAPRWRGVINGQQMYGFAICVTGLPDDSGRHEFDNSHVIVSGNTIAPLPSGGAIGIGLALDAIGRPIPGGPTSPFFPRTLRVENNAIVASSEYQGISIAGSSVRTTAIVSGNSFGGGQKRPTDRHYALLVAARGVCHSLLWAFDCVGAQRGADGAEGVVSAGLAGQLTASSFAALTVHGNTMPPTNGAAQMSFANISGSLRVTGNVVEPGAAAGACFVPLLANVSVPDMVVESSGSECPSPVTIPVGGRGPTEVTVWSEGGAFGKVVIVGQTVHGAQQLVGLSIAVNASGFATLSTSDGKALSFSALPKG